MGMLTSEHPKCMTEISPRETILSRQLNQLAEAGVKQVVITTGLFDHVLEAYCESLDLPLEYTFVHNPDYRVTNYIYSIYLAREVLDDDILLMHGDLVFENEVLDRVLASETSCMTVSTTLPLPEKDFKAVIRGGKVMKVGVGFFENAAAAQALYHLKRDDWRRWLKEIEAFVDAGKVTVYAEEALNALDGAANIAALDVRDLLCAEIDDAQDLAVVTRRLKEVENRTVYMCFSTDLIHGGHIEIIRKARRLGRLIVGVLSDEAVASYKRFPLVPCAERMKLFENIGEYKGLSAGHRGSRGRLVRRVSEAGTGRGRCLIGRLRREAGGVPLQRERRVSGDPEAAAGGPGDAGPAAGAAEKAAGDEGFRERDGGPRRADGADRRGHGGARERRGAAV